MSLKAIEIDPLLLAGLYKHPIVAFRSNETDQNPAVPGNPIPALGNNSQNILLVVHNPSAPYLDEQLFDLLINILKACHYSLDDVALVNTASGEPDWFHLKVQFSPHRIILFGNPVSGLASGKRPNDIWEADNCYFLLADTLEAIHKNVALKTLFWKALQQFFQIRK